MLEAAGLTAVEEDAYGLLLDGVELGVADIARLLQRPEDKAVAVLESLRSKGLVSRVGDRPTRYTAIPPDLTLAPLLLHRQALLDGARAEVARLTDRFRSSVTRRDAGKLVQVISGTEAIRQALRSVQRATREESLWFCRAGHIAMPSRDNTEELEMLAEGVQYRVIYEQALLEEAGMIADVARGIRHGEIARATPKLPIRLAIADRSVGICSLVRSGESAGVPSVALVRESTLLEALVALFDRYWANASPLRPWGDDGLDGRVVGPGGETITDSDRRLLSLLVAGVTDTAIASQMQVSHRTVQRRIRDLMDRAGAETRMHLAWLAARHGWV